MPNTDLFQTIEQTLTFDYKENARSYEEFISLLANSITHGQDDRGTAFTQKELQDFAVFKERLLAKKAEDTRPRIGGSIFFQ